MTVPVPSWTLSRQNFTFRANHSESCVCEPVQSLVLGTEGVGHHYEQQVAGSGGAGAPECHHIRMAAVLQQPDLLAELILRPEPSAVAAITSEAAPTEQKRNATNGSGETRMERPQATAAEQKSYFRRDGDFERSQSR